MRYMRLKGTSDMPIYRDIPIFVVVSLYLLTKYRMRVFLLDSGGKKSQNMGESGKDDLR